MLSLFTAQWLHQPSPGPQVTLLMTPGRVLEPGKKSRISFCVVHVFGLALQFTEACFHVSGWLALTTVQLRAEGTGRQVSNF